MRFLYGHYSLEKNRRWWGVFRHIGVKGACEADRHVLDGKSLQFVRLAAAGDLRGIIQQCFKCYVKQHAEECPRCRLWLEEEAEIRLAEMGRLA